MIRPTIEYLRECFSYDPLTGLLTWKARPREHFRTERGWTTFNSQCAGKQAGHVIADGHRRLQLNGKNIFEHQIAWAIVTGAWPVSRLDHEDRNPANNVFDNLRFASNAENQANSTHRKRKYLKGVRKSHHGGKFYADMVVCGRWIYLGTFGTEQDAHMAYMRHARMLYGEFAYAGTVL